MNEWTAGNSIIGWDRELRRVWLFKRRCHHGPVGCLVVALGLFLTIHDWHDRREWFNPHQSRLTTPIM